MKNIHRVAERYVLCWNRNVWPCKRGLCSVTSLLIFYILLEVVKRRYEEVTYIKKKEVKRENSREKEKTFGRIMRIQFFFIIFSLSPLDFILISLNAANIFASNSHHYLHELFLLLSLLWVLYPLVQRFPKCIPRTPRDPRSFPGGSVDTFL